MPKHEKPINALWMQMVVSNTETMIARTLELPVPIEWLGPIELDFSKPRGAAAHALANSLIDYLHDVQLLGQAKEQTEICNVRLLAVGHLVGFKEWAMRGGI